MKLQQLLSYVRKACDDYAMIEDGDRIAVGVSGGKDSLSLLVALKSLQRFYPRPFHLEAVTVSLGLEGGDYTPVARLCEKIGVNYTVVETEIGKIVFDERKEKNPCSLCAKMRKGALNAKLKELNCNKIAYGHNKDDVIETLFMSMFYEGRIYTFRPVTYLDVTEITCIRPLVYAPEKDIISFVKKESIEIVKSPCPVDKLTKREDMKNRIQEWNGLYRDFDEKIFGAIQRLPIDGWRPSSKGRLDRRETAR